MYIHVYKYTKIGFREWEREIEREREREGEGESERLLFICAGEVPLPTALVRGNGGGG